MKTKSDPNVTNFFNCLVNVAPICSANVRHSRTKAVKTGPQSTKCTANVRHSRTKAVKTGPQLTKCTANVRHCRTTAVKN